MKYFTIIPKDICLESLTISFEGYRQDRGRSVKYINYAVINFMLHFEQYFIKKQELRPFKKK